MSLLSVKNEPPLKIHVAKAKDLPFSWYELVLRPDKFAEHLKVLQENKEASPTAAHLIVTFLEKARVYSVLSNNSQQELGLSFMDVITGEKEGKLVKCALMMASFLRWDFSQLWEDLPPSVQYCLVSLLRSHYPPPEAGVFDSEGVAAHVIFSAWVLRFVTQECYSSYVQSRPPVQTWDTACVPVEQIKDMVKLKVKESLTFLTDFLSTVTDLPLGGVPSYWPVPRVCVDLPVLSGEEVHLEPFQEDEGQGDGATLFCNRLCELEYIVGCFHVVEERYDLAHQHLKRTQQLLARSGDVSRTMVDEGKLRGFLMACEGVLGVGEEKRGREEPSSQPEDTLEHHLQAKDYESVVEVLVRDLQGERSLSSELMSTLEREVPSLDEAEPKSKRQKLESCDVSSLLDLSDKVTICSGIKRVLEGRAPHPWLWSMLRAGNMDHIEFILQLCEHILMEGMPLEKQLHLQNFVRSVCSGNAKAWEQLLTCKVSAQLTLPQDSEAYKSFLVSAVEVEGSASCADYVPSSIEHLERTVSQATCPHELTEAMEQLYKATPTSQYKALALKWVGSSRLGFAPVEGMGDFLIVTKYNSLIHRAQILGKNQCYDKSVELFTAAQELVNSGSFGSSKVRMQLRDYVDEQLLVMEMLMVHGGGCWVECRASPRYAALMAKAKSYFTNTRHWSGPESTALHVVSAFLINAQEFPFLFQYESHHASSMSTVPPRLAVAVVYVMDPGRDLRKVIRSLFEAVLAVFSPLLHTNEGKVEGSERQSKLRVNLDLFIRNLRNNTALSLLAAALARMWNLLKKPENDILTDFNGHWPTAIGNAANIDAGHIFRMLNTVVNHALHLYPQSTSWIIIKANIHSAIGEYGAALESYMEAAALTSDYFHKEIPDTVWSQVILRRLINCCCRLSYHTQAVILCQLLQPVDYELAFSILKENTSQTVDTMFPYFWDMTIIEYLIYIHSKKMDSHKQAAAIQVAGQIDLNFNNSMEVLNRAAQVRRSKFLRVFYTQLTHAI